MSPRWLATVDPATEQFGGKAASLARLHALALPVPDALLLGCEHFERFIRDNRLDAVLAEQRLDLADPSSFTAAAERMQRITARAAIPAKTWAALLEQWQSVKPGAWIVRSSALGEDSDVDSFAGQLDSILHVRSAGELEQALRSCWASFWSARVLFYQHARGRRLRGMGVIVQRMIDATMGGVLFTRSPNHANALAIEYVHGHPGDLVAGAVEPERMLVRRGAILQAEPFAELVRIGLALESEFGKPQDIEWLVDRADKLWIVQSRPITTAASWQVFSNVNVNENYPRPLSPLLYSIASDAYAHYFRNLGRLLGVRESVLEQLDGSLRHCVGVHGTRLYYNLTNIRRTIAAAPFGAQLGAAFEGFVGIEDERRDGDRVALASSGGSWRERVRTLLAASRAFASLPGRVARFEARVDGHSAATERLEQQSVEQLLERLREFMQIRLHRWTDAALADLAATLSYAWLRWTLARTLGERAAKRLPQTLLLAIPGLVSGKSIERLWQLSRMVLAEPALRQRFAELAHDHPEALLHELCEDPRWSDFVAAFDEYLRECGFRISGELMLTTQSYCERPAALLPVLASYVELDGPAPEQAFAEQAKRRDRALAELRGQLRPHWRLLLMAALRSTQRAIGYRERVRLQQALLYSRLRAVVRELGAKLLACGRLSQADDLLFLTWREIDDWLSGHAMFPAAIGELVQLRRREHARLSAMHPPDTVHLRVGDYLDRPREPDVLEQRETLAGIGVVGGRTSGVARVLTDLSQADSFVRGDCLVTRQTDPGWAPIFYLAKGLVMERGGMLSHGAIVAREFGIPGVIAVAHATRLLRSGERIEIDGDRGLVRRLDGGKGP